MGRPLHRIGATVFERGWLSSNNVLFAAGPHGAAIVDTGYWTHAQQTIELLTSSLDGRPLRGIVNTHLHSDHCGGNAALQARWHCSADVPAASLAAVKSWDGSQLTYLYTDQGCPQFAADRGLECGETIELGGMPWQLIAARGHDPDAVMLFQPDERVLIAGDALWESRLAIIFPELEGNSGFGPAAATLDAIEAVSPRLVIPGHGPPFEDVEGALKAARARLKTYVENPLSHHLHAARSLVMFHMLELGTCSLGALVEWLQRTPVFLDIQRRASNLANRAPLSEKDIVSRLIDGGRLRLSSDGTVRVHQN